MKDFLRQNGMLLLVIALLASILIGIAGFVLSGEAQLVDLPTSDVQPHLIFDSVKDIIPLL